MLCTGVVGSACLAEAVAAGATLVKSPETVFWGGYSGYFQDPDGFLWDVAYNPHLWIGPAASESNDESFSCKPT